VAGFHGVVESEDRQTTPQAGPRLGASGESRPPNLRLVFRIPKRGVYIAAALLLKVHAVKGSSNQPEACWPVPLREREKRLLAMHGATATGEFLESVFRLLQATVVCDFALANLRNFGGVPLRAVDSVGREFGPDYLERFFQLNPSVSYVMLRPGLRLLHTKDHLPSGPELKSLPFYREFMQPENWRHSVALLFWGLFPPVPQNAFCVFRSEDQPDFDAEDLARLRALHPHIGTALKRLKKGLKTASSSDCVSVLLEALPASVTLLEWDLRITHQNAKCRQLSARWAGRGHENLPRSHELPSEVLAVCAAMKEEWRSALQAHTQARFHRRRSLPHPARKDLRAEIRLMLQQDSLLADPVFLIEICEGDPAATDVGNAGAKLADLSPAEREAALAAAEGLSNGEIAQRLGITTAAVKLRLHGAFKKLGVGNRTRLASLVR
jgi:DNA-binding CsgD family transcriptional regulator